MNNYLPFITTNKDFAVNFDNSSENDVEKVCKYLKNLTRDALSNYHNYFFKYLIIQESHRFHKLFLSQYELDF